MKNRKTAIKLFTVADWKKEQEYLRKQHNRGWKLRKINFMLYHFEKCEPEDMVYQLDFNQEGIKHKEEYVQMFLDCGWEYIQDWAGYSYFRKPLEKVNEQEEIFCDDASRAEMMKRVFKGRILPMLIIFFTMIPWQIHIQSKEGITNVMFWIFIAIFLLYVYIFARYAILLYKYKK